MVKCADERRYPGDAVREVKSIIRPGGIALLANDKKHTFKVLRLKGLIQMSFGKLEGPTETAQLHSPSSAKKKGRATRGRAKEPSAKKTRR